MYIQYMYKHIYIMQGLSELFCRPMLPLRFTLASLIRIGSLDGNSLDISEEQAEVAPAPLISRDVLLMHNSVGLQSD